MQQSKIIRLFKSWPPSHHQKWAQYLDSPFFGLNAVQVSIAAWLATFGPDFKDPALHMDAIETGSWDGHTLDRQQVRLVISQLYQHALNCTLLLEESPSIQQRNNLLPILLRHGDRHLFDMEARAVARNLQKSPWRNAEYYFEEYLRLGVMLQGHPHPRSKEAG
ncbi:MAG: hypothetical protein AAFV07_10765, partial [Bacteroidota bacterium]